MFRDAKEELERLEAELLAAEHEDDRAREDALLEEFLAEDDDALLADILNEPAEDKGRSAVYYNYSNNYGRDLPKNAAYNADRTDTDMNAYSDAVHDEKPESVQGLLVTVMLLMAGILGVLVYWLIRFL